MHIIPMTFLLSQNSMKRMQNMYSVSIFLNQNASAHQTSQICNKPNTENVLQVIINYNITITKIKINKYIVGLNIEVQSVVQQLMFMMVLCTMWTTLYCTGFSLCLSRSHLNGFPSWIHSVCSSHCINVLYVVYLNDT